MKKRGISILAAAVAFTTLLSGCSAPAANKETEAKAETKAEAAETKAEANAETEAAKSEEAPKLSGDLVIYSPNTDKEVELMIPAFEEKTGISVEVISGGTGEMVTRINAEQANPQADILWGGMDYSVYVANPDIWEEYVSPNVTCIPEEYMMLNGFYTTYCLAGDSVFVLNTDVLNDLGVNPDDIKGYEDLLNPALKGWIAMSDPTSSSSAYRELTTMLLDMGSEPYADDAWDYVDAFIGQLDGKLLSSSSAVYKNTADGEFAVGVSYEDPCVGLMEDGAENLKLVYPKEGAKWAPGCAAIIKNAPNMENAKAFIDFLLSDETQEMYATLTCRPINLDKTPTSQFMPKFDEVNLVYEDAEIVAKEKEKFQAKWTELYTKQN